MGILLAAIPEVADARHCQQFFHHKVQQVVAVPYVYSVGEGIRTDAVVEKALQRFVQKVQAGEIQLNAAPQTLAQNAPQSAFAKCIRCHSEGKSELVLDGRKLTCDQYHRFDEIFMLRESIPPEMKALVASLSQEEMGAMKEAVVRMGKPTPGKWIEPAPPAPSVPVGGGLE